MTTPEEQQSTPTPTPAPTPGAASSTEAPQSGEAQTLLDELRALGSQLEAVARAFLASNKAHQMQQDLQNGVNELVTKLQGVAGSDTVTGATERGKQLVEKALENPTVTDAHAKVVSTLGNLNEELRKLAASLEDDKKPNDPPSA